MANKDNKIKRKIIIMKHCFQLETGQIRGCIGNAKLTLLYLAV